MRKLLPSSTVDTHTGFTLIELLVAIAVVGILSAAVLVAINPLQKINQAYDSKIKSDVGQIATGESTYFSNVNSRQSYADQVSDLVTKGELASQPFDPSSNPYTIRKNPGSCSTAGNDCTSVAIFHTLGAPLTTGNGWCWKSATGQASESTDAACTP